jgi:hypothetical protein
MATTTGAAGSGEPDMALIGELLEDISRNPPAIAARKLLVEHYISVGWLDAAMDNAKELKSLAPRDPDIATFLDILQKKPEPPAAERKNTARSIMPATLRPAKQRPGPTTVELNGDVETARKDLTQGYQALRARAKSVLADLLHLQTLQKKAGLSPSKSVAKIQNIAEGRKKDVDDSVGPPGNARSAARMIRDNPNEATTLAITDLEKTMKWVQEPYGHPSNADTDTIRDALVKRKMALESALPDGLKLHCEIALMHLEHENLERNYANTETMFGDEVKDIPRANFYVTEDNYAWDMDELAQAITAGKGIMRNPLSKEMFTTKDIKGILSHPLGKDLAALAVEQHEMSKGVRTRTIDEMDKLAEVLLEDQSADTIPSRKAVDEFLAYVATCMYLCFHSIFPCQLRLQCSSARS